MRDEYAIVLDFLKHGYPAQRRAYPIAQVLGEDFLNLLEVIPREGVTLKSQERVYIGLGKRDKIKSVCGKINSSKLTATARTELPFAVEKIVNRHEKRFVDFFNNAGPITVKLHQLELIPSIGKKHLWHILTERKKKPFESFEDIGKRVSSLTDPKRSVVKRILDELEGTEKWYLFITPPKKGGRRH